MNKEQTQLLGILKGMSDGIAAILKDQSPVDIFPDKVSLTSTETSKILNVCMTWSFQSEGLDDKPQLVLQDIGIGDTTMYKYPKGWEDLRDDQGEEG